MGKDGKEMLRFNVDAPTAGLWDKVCGDIHGRIGKKDRGEYLRTLCRVYLDLVNEDAGSVTRSLNRLAIEDGRFRT